MADIRPRIGITMRIELETDRFYLSRHYSEAIEAAGGVPLHLSLIPNREYLEAALVNLDGILLPGSNSDIDPLRYGQEPQPGLGTVHPLKDETDLQALEAAERLELPVLAICYGMQALNVSRGGTLIQDIHRQIPEAIKHEQGVPRDRPSHSVRLLEGSRLAAISQSDRPTVNSHHHQAIETVGRDLVASAWTSDGLVEALEDSRANHFVMAVQWHPELGWRDDQFSRSLFTAFISTAQRRKR